MKLPPLNALVAQTETLTSRQIILRVVPQDWQLPRFVAGQYVVLGLPPTAPRCAFSLSEREFAQGSHTDALPETKSDREQLIRRAYSIASSSHAGEYMDFYISLVSDGRLTPRLFALKVGDPLWLSSHPVGVFTLGEVPREKHIILIATGTGLAPYMSMLSSELDCGSTRRFAVLHGARHSWDLGYRAELENLQHLCLNFTYLPIISQADKEPFAWHGPTGRVQQLWQTNPLSAVWSFTPTPDNCDVFLCGAPGMIDEMLGLLRQDGFTEHRHGAAGEVHIERY
ncbi:MAG: ferredoxin--NADP reductase [Planctomycetales bacterium]|nr:ferredoxin--NADP reductase [Planctomycetales bacterium]